MLLSSYLLSAVCCISAIAAHPESRPKVVKVAIINGQKYELREIVDKAKLPKEDGKKNVEKNWQKKAFEARSMQPTKQTLDKQSLKPSHHHRHRHGKHHPHHPHHPHHGHRHHRKHRRCPCSRRRFNKAALFRTKPSFIKVVIVKETTTVDPNQKPLFKEIETTTNVYMKSRSKPFHKVSSSSTKAIVVAPMKKNQDKKKAGRPIIKAQAHKEGPVVKNLDDNQLVFFLLGMCSMLGFFAFVKGLMFLFRNDADQKEGYLKLDVEENSALIKEEQNGVSPAINQV